MIDRGIIEAAYLTGFEPSAEDLTEAALFEEAQAITAHARELSPERSRELHEISGNLMNRVKLNA